MEHKRGTYDSAYVFSTDRQEEVRKICQKYSPRDGNGKALSEEDGKMERLRRLDRSVARSGTLAALLTGACGAVIHGLGTVLIRNEATFAPGTALALAGLALFLAAYPVYCAAAKKQRRRVEAEILKLCKELMK